MRSHSFQVFDHTPGAHLPSVQQFAQRLAVTLRRGAHAAAATLFTLGAAAVLGVLTILLKR